MLLKTLLLLIKIVHTSVRVSWRLGRLAKNEAEVELFSPDSLCIELSSDSAPTGKELAKMGGEL
jgi:hypothetical protein